MTVTIVGIGLIGGSLALALKEKGIAEKIIGVESNPEHQKKALGLGLVDELMDLKEGVRNSDLVVLATPVHSIILLLPEILDEVEDQVVIDVGSTKEAILEAAEDHPRRGRFVATHPMWGTEYSGPEAAVKDAFVNKATVICD